MSPTTRSAMTIICLRSCFLVALSVSWMSPTGWGTSALLTSNQLFCVGGGRKPLVDDDDNSPVFRFVVGTGLEDGEDDDDDDDDGLLDVSLDAFQARKRQEQEQEEIISKRQRDKEFDGYALRDSIFEKWNLCYDVDFNRVDSFGFKCLYLNILPFHMGGRRFRHETEMDYLCHLQAVVEILQKYNQLDNVLVQIAETKKKPRAGTSPLVAVPIRLDLTPEEIKQILGY